VADAGVTVPARRPEAAAEAPAVFRKVRRETRVPSASEGGLTMKTSAAGIDRLSFAGKARVKGKECESV
jgi:hypothetical protein